MTVIYRTVKIDFRPRSQAQWATFTAARKEAARLWNDLLERHFRIRRARKRWPTYERWAQWAKGRYPHLHSQAVQQIIKEFLEAVKATTELRKQREDARYPWRKSTYRDVVYTNQGARIREGHLFLPNGKAGTLRIKLPEIPLPGRLMEVRLCLFSILLVCECEEKARPTGPTVGVDLGVNTLVAATNGERAVCVSGRAVKAGVRYRHKKLGEIQAQQAPKTKGSRRWKRLQRRKAKMLAKSKRRITDQIHQATRKIANEFPNAKAYVGEPFKDAAQKMDRKRAQTVSAACNRKIIQLLDYKLAGAIEVEEHYTSQTCPVCGGRSKQQRTYRCPKCGMTAPRDVVGCLNIRTLGLHGRLLPGQSLPPQIIFTYPEKFSGSSGGHPAGCSVGVT
jgi:putative transposase